jgi:hypothetical protein
VFRTLLAFTVISFAASAYAGKKEPDIVRWVDENGITQFTDASFAPTAEAVKIPKANRMDVPKVASASAAARPKFVKISKAPKKNKRGWRGHEGRSRASRRR